MSKPTLPHGDLMVPAEHRSWVETSLNQLARMEIPDDLAQSVDRDDEDFWSPEYSWARPYRVREGDLIIPVQGVLLHNFPYAFGSFATGYDYIVAAARRGAHDPNVNRVILHVNSPGGLVSGCFDATDELFGLRGEKPIIALADETALSAAYAIASAADEIVAARTGQVGSIGVMTSYVEMSQALENAGIKVNLIYAGDRKADGHPSQPLSDEARDRIQTRVNRSYDIFVSTVARNRGLSEEAVRATEADFYTSQEAVQNGLADRVGTLGNLSADAENSPETEDDTMSKEDTPAVDKAAHDAAVAKAAEDGRAQGVSAERERIAAILDSDEAKARPAAARMLAFDTDKEPDAAKASLAKLPEEVNQSGPAETGEGQSQARGASTFENQMATTPNPNLAATDTKDGQDEATDADVADAIFTSAGYQAAS